MNKIVINMYAEVSVDVTFSLFGSVPECVLVLSHGKCVQWFAKELPNFFQKWLFLPATRPISAPYLRWLWCVVSTLVFAILAIMCCLPCWVAVHCPMALNTTLHGRLPQVYVSWWGMYSGLFLLCFCVWTCTTRLAHCEDSFKKYYLA